MTSYFPGPYSVELRYLVDGVEHTQEFSVFINNEPGIGRPFAEYLAYMPDATEDPLDDVCDAYAVVMLPLMATTVTLISATLWQYTAFSYERSWVSEYAMAYVGSHASPYIPAGQLTFSFRSSNGGIFKAILLESSAPGNDQSAIASLTSTGADYADWFLSDDCPFLARDNGRPIAGLLLSRGQNERVFRKRFR